MLENEGYRVLPGVLGTFALRAVRAAAFQLLVEQGNAAPLTMPHRKATAVLEAMAAWAGDRETVKGLGSELFFMPPGSLGFLPHQDNHFIEAEPADALLSLWIPLVDTTPERGCLRVWPGSHTQGRRPVLMLGAPDASGNIGQSIVCALPPTPSLDLPMRAGDGVFLHGDIVHASHDNRSGRWRPALLLTYIRKGAKYRAGNRQQREAFDL